MITRVFNKIFEIEARVQRDEGNRGIKPLIANVPQLYEACTQLLNCKTIGILTGFPCLVNNIIKIESDGLAGALCLSRILNALNISSTILIDSYSVPHIESLINWHNTEFNCNTSLSSSLDLDFEGIISIERPGRAEDGNYYTMRGIQMDGLSPFDTVYLDTKPCKTKVAIGDGGNEAGLGPIRSKVHEFIKNGKTIASCSYSDYILISSVST